MSSILQQLDHMSRPGTFEVKVPAGTGGFNLNNSIEGSLELSRGGYVYNLSSKPVLWLKFLGLGIYLPLEGLVSKCKEIAMRMFNGSTAPAKGFHDLDHVFNLAKIAWKGALFLEPTSLSERVEEFALAELDYNSNNNRNKEMERSRSERLLQGVYAAKCMQPLFHKDQYNPSLSIRERIAEKESSIAMLRSTLEKKATNPGWQPAIVESWLYPDSNLNVQEIKNKLSTLRAEKKGLENQIAQAKRCEKYAAYAIFNQQSCPYALDAATETQVDVECCGTTCYSQQRVCGLLYKINCCATQCWALDCFCCVCCIWPDARRACVIT